MKHPADNPRVIITMGDPAGIGPEVMVKALSERIGRARTPYVVVGARNVIAEAAARYGSTRLRTLMAASPWIKKAGEVAEADGPLTLLAAARVAMGKLKPGRSDAQSGRAAWESLEAAMILLRTGAARALVTAPVNKAALADAGFPYAGHTDWLQVSAGGRTRAVMMLCAGSLRVVPVTVHLPLSQVPRALTPQVLFETIVITAAELSHRFRIRRPRLAISGLNPHAGEAGRLGGQEQAVIAPAIAAARAGGIDAAGPLPADSMFTPSARRTYDAALCMYHDQALIPFKTLAMTSGVNLTLGLPFIRTSPAHGTAPEIAGQGRADHRSFSAALDLAEKLARAE
jgi:4-hydroxythreonine-4-phosphate dehydrogenase